MCTGDHTNASQSGAHKERRRKRVPPKIISFDDDNLGQSSVTKAVNFVSAPSTCMNSPVALSVATSMGSDIDRTSSTLVAAPSVTSIASDGETPSKTSSTPSVTVTKAREALNQLEAEVKRRSKFVRFLVISKHL